MSVITRLKLAQIGFSDFIEGKENISPIVPIEILKSPYHRFDFSRQNHDVEGMHLGEPQVLRSYILSTLRENRCGWGLGGWAEERSLYRTHPFFKNKGGERSIHLGMDMWLPANTSVHMPFTGRVHGLRDNSFDHAYGPSILTEHYIDDVRFYVLFSHLHENALDHIQEGALLRSGDQIATVSSDTSTAKLPPHLHVQLITDLAGHNADFPEITRLVDKKKYMNFCHNPEILLFPFMTKTC